jgi:5-methylcytosine-specific restriction endonuclease McrA
MAQTAEYFKAYKLKNKERIRRQSHAFYLANKERILASNRRWRENNPEKALELKRRWMANNPEQRIIALQKIKIWRKKNPEKVKLQKKRHQLKHSERLKIKAHLRYKRRWLNDPFFRMAVLQKAKLWHKNNPDRVRQKAKRWIAKNRDKVRAYSSNGTQKRRALQRGNTVNPKSILKYCKSIRSKESVRCYYCNEQFSGKIIHFDHIIPLSKGGPHSVENLCASCPKCNQSKHNKLVSDWIKFGQQMLSL